jgi:hypothetical protein
MKDVDTRRKPAAPDALVRALAKYVAALDERYPDGPPSVRIADLAITDDIVNMRVVRRRPTQERPR